MWLNTQWEGPRNTPPPARTLDKGSSLEVSRHPVPPPSVEGLAVEVNVGIVTSLLALKQALPPKLHPGHSQNGPGIRTGEAHRVFLAMLQEVHVDWGRGKAG